MSVSTRSSADVDEHGTSPWDSQHQEFDYSCHDIEGQIPEGLRGTLFRIGPGRLDVNGHPVNHIFDGDGMVSRVEFGPEGVHYRNRYVRTDAYRRANEAKAPLRGIGTQRIGGALANALRVPANLANTNVLVHDEKLYALWEGGRPHRLDIDTLATEGVDDFGGALKRLGAFSAHPKTDPKTGEVFNFGLDFFPRPMIRCYRLAPDGRLRSINTVALQRLGFIHDFALTERHLVFVIDPLILTGSLPVVLGMRPFDDALTFRPERGTTIVLVPRDGGPSISVEHEALFHFHVTNAYEDGGHTVVEMVDHAPGPDGWKAWNHNLRNFRDSPGPSFGGTLKRLTINRAAKRARTEDLNDLGCEFPQLDQRFATTRHRYSYLAEASAAGGDPDTITTVDHETGQRFRHHVGAENTICEPLFAPASSGAGEGDGWLLTLEHQPAQRCSRVLVLPARRPDEGPVAAVRLRHHVPMTFHGAFVPM